ncbi:SEC10/PgrA surface exclusion domain-containing protein [Streptococcus hongkongensis]|nr:membrane protein [Streptococcus uberis]
MELDNAKTNHIKATIALTSTLALLGASVGVTHQVKADDLSPKGNGNSNKESSLVPLSAEAASAAVKKTQTQLVTQQTELIEVNQDIKEKSLEVSDLMSGVASQEKAVASAQNTLTVVSIANDKEFTKLVSDNQAKLNQTNQDLVQARANEKLVSTDVEKQRQLVANENEAAKALVAKVASADKTVADVTTMVNKPEVIASQIAAAEKAVKITTTDLTKAQSNLNLVKEETKRSLSTSLTTNKSALTAKQAELNAAQSQLTQTSTNIVGNNTFVLPSSYPINELKQLAASGYIGSWPYNVAFQALEQRISSKAKKGMVLNSYKDIAKDINRQVNLDNLTADVQNELALFTAQMLNSVRSQLNLSQIVVTEGSQQFARMVTDQYKATHKNSIPYFTYGQVGAGGHYGIGPHDRTIIESSASRVGLKAKDDNMYENFGMFDDLHTVNGIKRSIYNTLKYMLFTDDLHGNTWGHAINFLRTDKANSSNPIYLGFSTESVGGLDTHFLLIPKSNIQNPNLFSTKQVVAGKTTVNNATQIQKLKTTISTIKGDISTLENRLNHLSSEEVVKTAQAKVTQLNTKLTAAKQSLAKFEAQSIQAKQSKEGLRIQLASAKKQQADVKAKLDHTLLSLNSAKLSLKTLEGKLIQASAQVTSLVDKKTNLEKLLTLKQNPNRVTVARDALVKAEKELVVTKAKLKANKETLAALYSTRTRLLDAIKLSEKQLTLLNTVVKANAEKAKVKNQTQALAPTVKPQALMVVAKPAPLKKAVVDRQVAPELAAVVGAELISAVSSEVVEQESKPVAMDQKSEKEVAQIKAEISEKIATATSSVMTESNKVLTNEASKIAQAIVAVVPESLPSQSVLKKVVDSVSDTSRESDYYGSTTVSSIGAANDESTQRAVRAGVVMLSAVGLAGVKLKRQGRL